MFTHEHAHVCAHTYAYMYSTITDTHCVCSLTTRQTSVDGLESSWKTMSKVVPKMEMIQSQTLKTITN